MLNGKRLKPKGFYKIKNSESQWDSEFFLFVNIVLCLKIFNFAELYSLFKLQTDSIIGNQKVMSLF